MPSNAASIYTNLFIFIEYTALDLVLCLVIQTSSFWRVQLWRFQLSHGTTRQWQIQHLQCSGFYSGTMDIVQNFSDDSRSIFLTEWDKIYMSQKFFFFFLHFRLLLKISQLAAFYFALHTVRNTKIEGFF